MTATAVTAGRWGQAGVIARPLLPASLFYVIFFAVPMLALFILSFWRANGFVLIPDFTLDNYEKIATSSLYRVLIIRTITVGFITAAIVVPLAFAISYLMRFVFEK